MEYAIGLDIGGTKIAGAAFDNGGKEIAQITMPTPITYEAFLDACRVIVEQLQTQSGKATSIGACSPYADAHSNANIPLLINKPFQKDLEKSLGLPVPFANDANCAALAEALEGAGKNYSSVFGLIMGTGIGGGYISNGQMVSGANGLCGEIGHLPLPYYENTDGVRVACGCGQKGCIEKLIAGPALARLYHAQTGQEADAKQIGDLARDGNAAALGLLDRYYTIVAKATVAILHSFDPDIITVSGGLSGLPGLYESVPKRWGQFALNKTPKTKFVPAHFGAMAGLRGAAWLGKSSKVSL